MKPAASNSTEIIHKQSYSLMKTLYTQLLCEPNLHLWVSIGAAVFSMAIIAMVFIFGILAYQQFPQFPKAMIEYNTMEHQINRENQKTLKVYDFSLYTGSDFLKALYEAPEIQQKFGAVRIQWRREEMEGLQQLNTHPYDLLVIKQSWMQKTSLDVIARYTEIASYQTYSGYLIAVNETPRLTTNYLEGKRLGLLDNPTSMSGHLVPRRALHEAGIDEQILSIRYYKTHAELRTALLKGELDLIGSYWGNDDEKRFNIANRLEVMNEISGSKWYLSPKLIDTPAHCAIVRILKKRADESKNAYFKKIQITRNCDHASD